MTFEYINTHGYRSFKRYCRMLDLQNDPVLIEEYRKIHAKGNVWPEITRGMKEVGIVDMEIYIYGTRLFMIMDTIPEFDYEKGMTALSQKPRQSEWEAFVARFQRTRSDATADEKWQPAERIYKLDRE